MGGILRLWLSVVCCGRDVNLNLFNDKLVRKVFLPHPSSPARRGSTSPPKSSPSQEGGLKAWPAGPVLANKLSPLKGLLVEFYAIELRLFDATELRVFDATES